MLLNVSGNLRAQGVSQLEDAAAGNSSLPEAPTRVALERLWANPVVLRGHL